MGIEPASLEPVENTLIAAVAARGVGWMENKTIKYILRMPLIPFLRESLDCLSLLPYLHFLVLRCLST